MAAAGVIRGHVAPLDGVEQPGPPIPVVAVLSNELGWRYQDAISWKAKGLAIKVTRATEGVPVERRVK
jgi:hypothetical protein